MKVLSASTTASSTTSNGFLIDIYASVRVTFNGFTWTPSIFLISNDGIELIPSPRPHRASFMDNIPIELKLSGSLFFWGSRPWNIALQFLVNVVDSSLFNVWGYDNLTYSKGSYEDYHFLQGFVVDSFSKWNLCQQEARTLGYFASLLTEFEVCTPLPS